MVDAETRGSSMVVIPASSGAGYAQPFAIGRYEVSVGEYNAYCNVSGNCAEIAGVDSSLPVTELGVGDAKKYARWLSEATGQTYRLPTDDEWVYAARAGDKNQVTDFNCTIRKGSNIVKGNSLIDARSGEMNGWGLRNHIGNAREWTEGGSLLVRGGSYQDPFTQCDISLSIHHDGQADPVTGFRLVREL